MQFQCPHCATLLRIPREDSGREGPCPVCFHIIASPAVAIAREVSPRRHFVRESSPIKGTVVGTKSISGRSISRGEKKSLNSGVMADQAIHHGEEKKKELRRERMMFFWCAVVFLLLAASTYVMKSLVAGR